MKAELILPNAKDSGGFQLLWKESICFTCVNRLVFLEGALCKEKGIYIFCLIFAFFLSFFFSKFPAACFSSLTPLNGNSVVYNLEHMLSLNIMLFSVVKILIHPTEV